MRPLRQSRSAPSRAKFQEIAPRSGQSTSASQNACFSSRQPQVRVRGLTENERLCPTPTLARYDTKSCVLTRERLRWIWSRFLLVGYCRPRASGAQWRVRQSSAGVPFDDRKVPHFYSHKRRSLSKRGTFLGRQAVWTIYKIVAWNVDDATDGKRRESFYKAPRNGFCEEKGVSFPGGCRCIYHLAGRKRTLKRILKEAQETRSTSGRGCPRKYAKLSYEKLLRCPERPYAENPKRPGHQYRTSYHTRRTQTKEARDQNASWRKFDAAS
jgi:hypothetical protein